MLKILIIFMAIFTIGNTHAGDDTAGVNSDKKSKLTKCLISGRNVFVDEQGKVIPYERAIKSKLCKLRNDDHIKEGYRVLAENEIKKLNLESCINPKYPNFRRHHSSMLLGAKDAPFVPMICTPEGTYIAFDKRHFSGMINGYYSKFPDQFEKLVEVFDMMNSDQPEPYLRDYNQEQRELINKMVMDFTGFEEFLE